MLCFRHRDVLDMDGGLNYLHSLRLQRVIHCGLCPMQVLLPSVCNEFLKIMEPLGIVSMLLLQ